MKAILIVFLLISACTDKGGKTQHSKPSVTRDYGYVIGDIIPMDYPFDLRGDRIDATTLPSVGPINDWLAIRALHVDIIPHRDGEETRVHVDYQLFKGIKEPEVLTIPPLSFRLQSQPESSLSTDPWSFTQVPVIPPEWTNESIEPHEGMSGGLLDVRTPSRRLAYWFSAVLGIGLMMGLKVMIQRRKIYPFRSSQSKVRAALRDGADAQTVMEGMRLMHRAFDHTFGQTLFQRDIPRFMDTHRHFRPAEDDLVAFFTLSGGMFFDPSPKLPATEDLVVLRRLLNQCLRAERGQM